MKAQLLILTILMTLLACNTNNDKSASAKGGKNVQDFTATLDTLNKADMNNISRAVSLFDNEIKQKEEGDNALPHLLKYINQSVDTLNDILEPNGDQYASLVYDTVKMPSPQQASFIKTVMNNHLQLLRDGEGGVYLEYDYGWLSKNIGNKLSDPVKQYLEITATEATQPLTRDAAIMLPPQTFVERLVNIENLQKQALPADMSEDLKKVNKLYMNALLFGADNTPAVDYNTLQFTPAFQQAYNHLLSKYPQSAAAAKVKEWQQVVVTKNGKAIDDYIQKNSL
jgi:hypothetical protein